LAGEVTVFLVNAAHVTQVPGRKTDKADARWLAKLMRRGLLQASFMPSLEQRDLRELTRYRTRLVPERSREVNRRQGVLERANIKLAAVATDIMGASARAILAALLEGRADPATGAEWAKRRRRSTMPLLEQAATGLVRDHHRRLLALQVAHLDVLDEQIDALSAEMTRRLAALSDDEPAMRRPRPTGEAGSAATPEVASAPLTFAQAVTLLDTTPGVNQRGGERLVAEGGLDMARVGTAARRAAWSGVAPGNDESAGTQRSGKIRTGDHRLRTGLTPLAHAAARTKGTYLSTLYQRLAARRGKKRAIMAVAHSIVVSAFHRRSRHEPYRELGANSVDACQRTPLVDRLTRRIERLGYHVTLEPVASP
jgi:transposase